MERTWFITGSSSGIGRGIARAVLERGDNAVVMARDKSKLQDLVNAYPKTAFAVQLELTDKGSIREAVKQAVEHFGQIDVLVNNAGHGYRAAIEEGEDTSITEVFGTNLFGAITLIQEVLPQMRSRRSGAIVNISSIAAVRAGVGSGYYAATKAALELVSSALYQEVKALGIKVMVVEPGAFRTNFYSSSMKGTQIEIPDYADTAGKNRKEHIKDRQDQPGDPDKAGTIIVETILQEESPRVLILGSDAVRFLKKQMATRIKDIEKWEKVSIQTDYT